jgi:hypothetical protein
MASPFIEADPEAEEALARRLEELLLFFRRKSRPSEPRRVLT